MVGQEAAAMDQQKLPTEVQGLRILEVVVAREMDLFLHQLGMGKMVDRA